jgi:hypothetical protein
VLAPPVKSATKTEPKKKSRDHAQPQATREDFERCLPRHGPKQERDAAQVLELAAQLALVNLLSGKHDPGVATADDITEEDDVIERAKRILGALSGGGKRSEEQG